MIFFYHSVPIENIHFEGILPSGWLNNKNGFILIKVISYLVGYTKK